METICLNCNHPIPENFCGHCGQKKYKRIDRKYLIDELQYSIIHTNKGFFYSIKNIARNPGKTARNFIEGNRINHYKPILLAFVLSGISAFLSFKVIGFGEIMKEAFSEKMKGPVLVDMMAIMTGYSALIMLMLVPVLSLLTKLAFRSWGQNYYEHVVMNAFVLAYYNIVSILLLYPILYLLRNNTSAFMIAVNISMIIIPIMMVWFYMGFYSKKETGPILGRVLIVMVIIGISYMVLIIGTMIISMLIYGPQAVIEYIGPPTK